MENKEKDVVEITEEMLSELKECSCSESEYKPMVAPYEMSEDEQEKYKASKQFKQGMQDSAYAVGMFTGLVNGGIDIMLAHEIVAGMISKQAQVESQAVALKIAQIKSVQAEKCEL